MRLLNRLEISHLQRELDHHLKYAGRVVDPACREAMTVAIQQGWGALEDKKVNEAKKYLHEAEHAFLMARYEGHVIFYATPMAVLVSVLYLCIAILVLEAWRGVFGANAHALPVVLAFVGGSIGGMTAVLSKVIGIRLDTQAVTTRMTWYYIKPALGAIMGGVTYFAFVAGLSLLSSTLQIDKMEGVFLVGFLGGYLESFSTRVLNELADRLAGESKPQAIESGDQAGTKTTMTTGAGNRDLKP